MAEALAERLLDLHCRLLSLYVLQDADCLNWEDPHPFFEGERGSFVIQMWWLYMQGNNKCFVIQMWWLYMQGNNKCFEIPVVFCSTRYLPCSEICRMYIIHTLYLVQCEGLSITDNTVTILVVTLAPKSVTTSLVRNITLFHKIMGACYGAVGWCTVLQDRKSRV